MSSNVKKVNITDFFFRIVKSHKYILLFPLLSISIAFSFLSITFLILNPHLSADLFASSSSLKLFNKLGVIELVSLFVFYFTSSYVVIFLNIGLIYCTKEIMYKKESSFQDGISHAVSKSKLILKWAIVSSTIGTILHIIHEGLGVVGQWISNFLGIAWGISVYFVLPILAFEDISPSNAIYKSISIMKNKWGKALAFNVTYGFLGILFFFLVLIPLGVTFGIIFSPFIGVFTVSSLFLMWSIAISSINAIFLTSTYLTVVGDIRNPSLYDESILDDLFVKKD